MRGELANMNVLALLQARFAPALSAVGVAAEDLRSSLEMIRPAQDTKFGDYQANFAMPLGKKLGKSPRDVATAVIAEAKLDDLCETPEVAGPGFINLRLKQAWLENAVQQAAQSDRLGIDPAEKPRTYIVDYSSPNVAKPMHVGHIRSTVIGDALQKTLRVLGHKVITDNHLGDWGTQFGMIIYGYKNFRDDAAYKQEPVKELGRLYKYVHQFVDYRESLAALPEAEKKLAQRKAELETQQELAKSSDKAVAKKANDGIKRLKKQIEDQQEEVSSLSSKIRKIESSPELSVVANAHATIDQAVLQETAKLHAGDAENLRLWNEFLPNCRDEIQKVYKRLNISFDYEFGESFYHDGLALVVKDLQERGLCKDSQGAQCVFLEGFDAPMIVQKRDGAFLYSTTDLATLAFRKEKWNPDAILYVVDHRQADHFDKLFAVARLTGFADTELVHVKFGTVLGEDGRPYKTRSGDSVGLESLLDEAVARALAIVNANEDLATLSDEERKQIAETVGIGALKYADLSQNRTTDYTFSYDKMLLMNGNTATYMQYSYARVLGIFRKCETTAEAVRAINPKIALADPAERQLALQLLKVSQALQDVTADYMPHHLTTYLFDLAKSYSTFFENCSVMRAESKEIQQSRLALCDLTARTIRLGLSLLGIGTVEKM